MTMVPSPYPNTLGAFLGPTDSSGGVNPGGGWAVDPTSPAPFTTPGVPLWTPPLSMGVNSGGGWSADPSAPNPYATGAVPLPAPGSVPLDRPQVSVGVDPGGGWSADPTAPQYPNGPLPLASRADMAVARAASLASASSAPGTDDWYRW